MQVNLNKRRRQSEPCAGPANVATVLLRAHDKYVQVRLPAKLYELAVYQVVSIVSSSGVTLSDPLADLWPGCFASADTKPTTEQLYASQRAQRLHHIARRAAKLQTAIAVLREEEKDLLPAYGQLVLSQMLERLDTSHGAVFHCECQQRDNGLVSSSTHVHHREMELEMLQALTRINDIDNDFFYECVTIHSDCKRTTVTSRPGSNLWLHEVS